MAGLREHEEAQQVSSVVYGHTVTLGAFFFLNGCPRRGSVLVCPALLLESQICRAPGFVSFVAISTRMCRVMWVTIKNFVGCRSEQGRRAVRTEHACTCCLGALEICTAKAV